ncbi:MAG: hypothetical protein KAJ46_00790 [Sedimentisphaerales bacterium]|nr:hypothetical protein [Sedimentisphaerales bacterium]
MLRFKFKTTIPIIAGLGVLLALAAYTLLPFWLPTGVIKEKIAQRLQNRFGREVSIGTLAVDLSGGTVISDVRVLRRREFSPGVLIRIGRIHCPLKPLSILRGEIPELRIEDADLFVIVDKDGRTNISDLPNINATIGRISIEQSKLHLLYNRRQAAKEQVFNIDSAQIHQNQKENRINLSLSARLTALADDEMRVDLQAQYFPATGVFQIEQTRVTGDGLKFDLAGRYDPCAADGNLFKMSLTDGQLEPQRLSRLLERFAAANQQLRKTAPADAGRLIFNADFDVTSKGAVLTGRIDGSEWALRNRYLNKKTGEPLCLDFTCRFDRDNASFGIDRMTALFKSMRVECRLTDLKLPSSQNIRFSDWLKSQADAFVSGSEKTALRARINLGDLRDLRSINGLEKLLNGWQLTGPAYIELDLSPEKDRISYARLVLPDESWCVIKNSAADGKNILVKNPDSSLEIKLSANRGQADPEIETLRLKTQIGEGGFDFGPVSLTFRNRREFALNGEWQLTNMQEWLPVLPVLEQTLRKNKITITGDCEGSVTVSEAADKPSRWISEIDAEKLFFQIGSGDRFFDSDAQTIQANDFRSRPFLRKEPGRRGRVRLELLETDDDGTIAYRGTVKLDQVTALLTGKTTLPISNQSGWSWMPQELNMRIDSGDLKKLPYLTPRLFDREKHISLGPYRIADLCGDGQLNLTLINKNNPAISVQSNSGQNWDVEFSLEASPAGFALKSPGAQKESSASDDDFITNDGLIADDIIILKQKDIPLRVQGRASLNQQPATIDPLSSGTGTQTGEITLAIAGLDWRMADSEGSLTGKLSWKPNGTRLFPSNLGQSFNRVELDIRTRLNHNDRWLRELPIAKPWYEKLGLSGQTTVESQLNRDRSRELFACKGSIDFTGTGGHIDLTDESEHGAQLKLTKPIGDTLKANFDLTSEDNGSTLRVRRLHFELPGTVIDCNGVLENANLIAFYQGKAEHPAEGAVFAVTLDANDIEQLTPWLEIKSATRDRSDTDEKDALALFLQTVKGQLHTSARGLLTFAPSFDWQLRQSRIDGDVRAWWLDTPIELSLRNIAVSDTGFFAPAITIRAGRSRMTLIAELEGPILPAILKGRIDLLAERIDADELTALLSMFRQSLRQADSVNQPQISAETVDHILGFLARCELNGSAHIDRYSYTDPHGQSRLQPDELRCRYQLRQGLANVTYLTALNGGVISGEMNCDFNDPNGTIRHHRTSRSIGISESLRPIVESEFPGLIVNGTISEDYELSCDLRCLLSRPASPTVKTNTAAPLSEQPCGFAGTGMTVLTDGLLYGPGGPGWLMSVFPGLKLVEYEWEKMTNRYESFPDGRKKNTMLFNGRGYDIYIEGTSTPVCEPWKYQQVMALLERDKQQAKERFNALQQGELKLSFRKRQRLEQRLRGLELLLDRHRQGRLLTVSEADYIAGGILCSGGKKLLEKPRKTLRIPFFQSHSYIIGRHTIGTKTTNIPLSRL